jgi:hypothetical protein
MRSSDGTPRNSGGHPVRTGVDRALGSATAGECTGQHPRCAPFRSLRAVRLRVGRWVVALWQQEHDREGDVELVRSNAGHVRLPASVSTLEP